MAMGGDMRRPATRAKPAPRRGASLVVTERREVLSSFFGLLALLAYARYVAGSGEKAESKQQEEVEASISCPCACSRWA
jgi:hypothetical protein